MGARLDALQRKFDEVNSGIEALDAAAGDDGFDADQEGQYETLIARADELKGQIEAEAKRAKSLTATAKVLADLNVAKPQAITRAAPAEMPEMSAGEFFSLFARAQAGDETATPLLRAVADQTTGDVPGLLPKQIVGNMLKLADSSRPIFASFTSRPMPDKGTTFDRPRLGQRVAIAEQSTAYTNGKASGTVGAGAEKKELISRKLTVTSDPVVKRTFGGVLDISQQAIDWSEPALLDIVLSDFTDMYAEVSEAEACGFLQGLVTTNTSPWADTDPGAVVSSISAAVLASYAAARRMPDTFWLSLDSAMALAGTTNADDTITAISLIRRALQDVGLNLSFVIGPQLAPGTRIVGNAGLVESYEKRNGILQAINVPLLGLDIGYSAYLAFYSAKVSNVAVGVVGLVE